MDIIISKVPQMTYIRWKEQLHAHIDVEKMLLSGIFKAEGKKKICPSKLRCLIVEMSIQPFAPLGAILDASSFQVDQGHTNKIAATREMFR